MQKKLSYRQEHVVQAVELFPLLCPVREVDWLDGWRHTMVHSISGLVEKGCIFSTPHHGQKETVWVVTNYDSTNHVVEFVRFTPEESVVQIHIQVFDVGEGCESHISYTYNALNEVSLDGLDEEFESNMKWWEKAINHYLATGEKLMQ